MLPVVSTLMKASGYTWKWTQTVCHQDVKCQHYAHKHPEESAPKGRSPAGLGCACDDDLCHASHWQEWSDSSTEFTLDQLYGVIPSDEEKEKENTTKRGKKRSRRESEAKDETELKTLVYCTFCFAGESRVKVFPRCPGASVGDVLDMMDPEWRNHTVVTSIKSTNVQKSGRTRTWVGDEVIESHDADSMFYRSTNTSRIHFRQELRIELELDENETKV